jgi:hypothetical protein
MNASDRNIGVGQPSMDTEQRRTLATRAAQSVGRAFGLPDGVPRILKDTNHTIVHLWPSPIVAKVATRKLFLHRSSSLERELDIARLLASSGAPVVSPATSVPAGPHHAEGVDLTFWNYCRPEDKRPVLPRDVGRTLRAVHDSLDDLKGCLPILPSFKLQLEEANELLCHPASTPQLPTGGRVFLCSLYRTVMEALGNRVFVASALHGDCHPGQIIATTSGLLWLDFEAACQGPKEWDVAGVERQAVKAYGPVDAGLLSLLKTARLLCITTWCWTQPDRDPEIREAAEYHLKYLKRRAKSDPH